MHSPGMKQSQRLSALRVEIEAIRTDVGILGEQVAYLAEVAEDARIRALVAETPLADRDAREARDDLERLTRAREAARERLARLEAEQDAILEHMFRAMRGGAAPDQDR